VATVVYSARTLDHIERAFLDAALSSVTAIRSAVENLAAHPLTGRSAGAGISAV